MAPDLEELVEILSDWAGDQDCMTIYLFGSRVRGDHRADSDVDVLVCWSRVTQKFFDWWTGENEDEFQRINSRLPGPLKILEYDDLFARQIIAAGTTPSSVRGNIVCVWLPPKPLRSSPQSALT